MWPHERRESWLASHRLLLDKWESVGLMDGYYVVRVTTILYPWFGVVINFVSKQDITYHVTIGDSLHCTCTNFMKMSSQSLGKKEKWVYYKHLNYVFRLLCNVDYDNEKFIHTPTFTYKEVMQLLDLADVVKCE